MTAPVDPARAEAHARAAVAEGREVVATSAVRALLAELDRLRAGCKRCKP